MVATFPTPYPFPVAPGGLRHSNPTRPLRGPPSAFVRQPDLGSAPRVFGLAGFGSGMGAFIRNNGSDADQSQGMIIIRCGVNPVGTGVVQLSFPAGIVAGQYVLLADWASFVLNVAGAVLQANWTASRSLLPNEVLAAAYQWTVSQ
jgi:hypothetical protein